MSIASLFESQMCMTQDKLQTQSFTSAQENKAGNDKNVHDGV